MESKNIKYIPALDHVRVYALILVIGFHCIEHFTQFQRGLGQQFSSNPFKTIFIEGHTGVAVFILSSGFIFYLITYGRKINYPNFIKNRVLRIFPLLVFKIFVGYCIFYKNLNFMSFFQLLLGFFRGNNIADFGANIWTLNVEFQFYLIFPLLMFLVTNKKNYIKIIILCIVFRILGFIYSGEVFNTSYFSLLGRLDQFLIGMFTADMYIRYRNKKIPFMLFPISVIVVLFTILTYNKLGGFKNERLFMIIWTDIEGIVWAFFIFTYLKFFNKYNIILNKIGEYSFSLYLMHSIIVGFVDRIPSMIWLSDPIYNPLLLGLVIVFPITFFISYLTYNLIEKPFLNLRVKYLEKD